MTRSTSHTPNLSAIEDRALARVGRLRAEVSAESRESAERRGLAWTDSINAASAIPRFRRSEREIFDSAPHSLNRDPCFACGVRGDLHANFGCKRGLR